jgi:hypothetical protein
MTDDSAKLSKKVTFKEEETQAVVQLNEQDEKIKRFSEKTNLNYQWSKE